MENNSQVEVLGTGVMPTVEANALFNPLMFEKVWAMAEKFVGDPSKPNTMLPKTYQGNPGAFLIALNVANDPKNPMNVLSVMQVLDIIQGKPSWASTHVIAMLNSSPKFPGGIAFHFEDKGEIDVEYTEWVKNENDPNGKNKPVTKKAKIKNRSCYVTAKKANGELATGTKVDLAMAIKEGWYFKNGSKWQTMEEQMLKYRSATFFSKTEAPEVLRGFSTVDEMEDIVAVTTVAVPQQTQIEKKRSFEELVETLKPLGIVISFKNGYAIATGGKISTSQTTLNSLGFVFEDSQYKCRCTEPQSLLPAPSAPASSEPNKKQTQSDLFENPVINSIDSLFLFVDELGLTLSDEFKMQKQDYIGISGGNTEGLDDKLLSAGFTKSPQGKWIRPIADLKK